MLMTNNKDVFLLTNKGEKIFVAPEDFEWLNQWKWFNHNGYAERSINLGTDETGKHKTKSIKMHRLIMGANAEMVDHINGNGLDNRRSNLRPATPMTNQRNRKVHYNKRFKGVNWHKRIGKWQVSIRVDKQLKHVGYFDDEVTAAREYDKAALMYFGNFARLNHV